MLRLLHRPLVCSCTDMMGNGTSIRFLFGVNQPQLLVVRNLLETKSKSLVRMGTVLASFELFGNPTLIFRRLNQVSMKDGYSGKTLGKHETSIDIPVVTSPAIQGQTQISERQDSTSLEILKSIVYGGLMEVIAILSIVAFAVAADATTRKSFSRAKIISKKNNKKCKMNETLIIFVMCLLLYHNLLSSTYFH
ncbi:hypothetical protein L2E82_16883 [Cichorium intybus]|uniref:Uncharacterized protein n=1 Tax=Cichorium intybus TaxID=13427 RepID=A0ACB9F690_CICIN|nr:hypothetical protein L2E82_16883 [Cichorium intybus]